MTVKLLSIFLGICSFSLSVFAAPATIISYNIRYAQSVPTVVDAWDNRKPLVVSVINDFSPDIFAIQEDTSGAQVDYMRSEFAARGFENIGYPLAVTTGYNQSIFFDSTRFDLIDSGIFWLSDTPEQASVTFYGTSSNEKRAVTWVKLHDNDSDALLSVYNAHLTCYSCPVSNASLNHKKSVELIAETIAANNDGNAVILMGDFNDKSLTDPVKYLRYPKDNLVNFIYPDNFYQFQDAFYDFDESNIIDHIFLSNNISIVTAEEGGNILDANGYYPSDHFAYITEVLLPNKSNLVPIYLLLLLE